MTTPRPSCDIPAGARLVCGFSGGADSLALLLMLNDLRRTEKFSLSAVHFNHNLRGKESDGDEEFCRRICERENIPFEAIRFDVKKSMLPGEGIEAAARRLRLENWKRIAGNRKRTFIVLAHHSGDVEENVFLRLFRGSNASGLSALRGKTVMDGTAFLRPILHLTKKEIEKYLLDRGETWRTDSSNLTCEYKRNYIRNRLLPELEKEFPFARGGILASASAVAADALFIENHARRTFARMKKNSLNTPEKWLSLDPAVRCRVLRMFLSEKLGHEFIPNAPLIERFSDTLEKICSARQGEMCIPLQGEPDFRLAVSPLRVTVAGTADTVPNALEWDFRSRPSVRFGNYILRSGKYSGDALRGIPPSRAVFDLDRLPETLTLRTREAGDVMIPFGSKENRSVSLKKLFSNEGPGRFENGQLPLVFADGVLIWAPFVRRSAYAPVAPDTPHTVEFSIERVE